MHGCKGHWVMKAPPLPLCWLNLMSWVVTSFYLKRFKGMSNGLPSLKCHYRAEQPAAINHTATAWIQSPGRNVMCPTNVTDSRLSEWHPLKMTHECHTLNSELFLSCISRNETGLISWLNPEGNSSFLFFF